MHFLVTGGCGYIGSHITKRLCDEGHVISVIDNLSNSSSEARLNIINKIATVYIADLSMENEIIELYKKLENVNAIIHVAALKNVKESTEQPEKYLSNNLDSTKFLIKYFNCPIVYSSSCAVYGNVEGAVDENASTNPQSPYATSKLESEKLLLNEYKNFVILRYFNPIGCEIYQLRDVSESCISTALRSGKVTIYGNEYDTTDGTCIRDYIHISDLVDAHILVLGKLINSSPCEEFRSSPSTISNKIYNVGTGTGVSVKELCQTYKDYVNKNLEIEYGSPRPGDVSQVWANSNSFRSATFFKAKKSLKDMVEDIL